MHAYSFSLFLLPANRSLSFFYIYSSKFLLSFSHQTFFLILIRFGFGSFFSFSFMASAGRPLPKFGEWDVNNPASAEGFTVIFNKARDEKKTKNGPAKIVTPRASEVNVPINKKENSQHSPKRKWLCCG